MARIVPRLHAEGEAHQTRSAPGVLLALLAAGRMMVFVWFALPAVELSLAAGFLLSAWSMACAPYAAACASALKRWARWACRSATRPRICSGVWPAICAATMVFTS